MTRILRMLNFLTCSYTRLVTQLAQFSPVPPGTTDTSGGCLCVRPSSTGELLLPPPSHMIARVPSRSKRWRVLPSGVAGESEPASCDFGCMPDPQYRSSWLWECLHQSSEIGGQHLCFHRTHVRLCTAVAAYSLTHRAPNLPFLASFTFLLLSLSSSAYVSTTSCLYCACVAA